MGQTLNLHAAGTLGTNAGPNADGCLVGSLAPTALTAALRESHALASLVITDDGGLYVNETAAANNATADDVEIVGATIAVADAFYAGHATVPFGQVDAEITTQGDYTDLVQTFKYWDGDAWAALSNVVDGTDGWEAAAGVESITFDIPEDWEPNTVDSVEAYWIQIETVSVTATVTQAELGQVWIIAPAGSAVFTDDTVDMNDAGTADVALFAAHPVVGDAFYMALAEKFCKAKLITSTARTGTATVTPQYWDGTSWEAFDIIEDKSAGFSATAGTHMVSFRPPSDWVANTAANGPDGTAGFFMRFAITALTSVTASPVASRAFLYPLKTGAVGVKGDWSNGLRDVTCDAETVSGANNDSVFLLVNTTTGAVDDFTFTQATQSEAVSVSVSARRGHRVAVVQIVEDGTTEFADVSFYVS